MSRFEHAVGVGYLAALNADACGIDQSSSTGRALLVAALIHDTATAPFGHTIERVLTPIGFTHANVLKALQNEYRAVSEEPYFAGAPPRLAAVVGQDTLAIALDAVLGLPPLGPVIANDLDLDNIDNVIRGAMHLGLGAAGELAMALAKAQRILDGEAAITGDGADLIPQWQKRRADLYDLLFESPEQVATEAMIFDAARRMVGAGSLTLADWRLTDHELIERFERDSDPRVNRVGREIRLGRTFQVVHQFVAYSVRRSEVPTDEAFDEAVRTWRDDYSDCDLVYLKHDFGQSRRSITRLTEDGERRLGFGKSSNKVTVTVLTRRSDPHRRRVRRERHSIARVLSETLKAHVEEAPDHSAQIPSALTLWQ
ncbi:MAG: HD domain-containing protein [Chloroflexota bacterium]|nr:HD domain-containing protein [Chloroflexota bacterium]